MPGKFQVTVKGGNDAEESYTIYDRLHDNSSVHAAEAALKSFREHGHTLFPFDRRAITVTVVEQDES